MLHLGGMPCGESLGDGQGNSELLRQLLGKRVDLPCGVELDDGLAVGLVASVLHKGDGIDVRKVSWGRHWSGDDLLTTQQGSEGGQPA